jgi:hypothetical protein
VNLPVIPMGSANTDGVNIYLDNLAMERLNSRCMAMSPPKTALPETEQMIYCFADTGGRPIGSCSG